MRLIDADEALELIRVEYKNTQMLIKQGEIELDNISEGFTEVAHIIQYLASTVDAVPVVRCRDCRYCDPSNGVFWCDRFDSAVQIDGMAYCSYGKRKLKEDKV